jgi:hypothetical protein
MSSDDHPNDGNDPGITYGTGGPGELEGFASTVNQADDLPNSRSPKPSR